MTTIETTEPISQEKPPKMGEDSCIACGYSLLGIADGGKCPECGLIVLHSRYPPRLEDLSDTVLVRLSRSAACVFLSSLVIVVCGVLLFCFTNSMYTYRYDGSVSERLPLVFFMAALGVLGWGVIRYGASVREARRAAGHPRPGVWLVRSIGFFACLLLAASAYLCIVALLDRRLLPWNYSSRRSLDMSVDAGGAICIAVIACHVLMLLLCICARRLAGLTARKADLAETMDDVALNIMLLCGVSMALILMGVVLYIGIALPAVMLFPVTVTLFLMLMLDCWKLPPRIVRDRRTAQAPPPRDHASSVAGEQSVSAGESMR